MNKVWMVIRREYLQSVSKKSFWIGTLAFPALMVVMMGLVVGSHVLNPESQKSIVFVDLTGELTRAFEKSLSAYELTSGEPEYLVETEDADDDVEAQRQELEKRILEGELYAVLVAGEDIEQEENFSLYRKNVGDEGVSRVIRRALQDAVVGLRLERSSLNLDQDILDEFVKPITLENFRATATGEEEKIDPDIAVATSFIFSMLFYFFIYFYGYATTRGIIQEKSNRVMEVLLGSLSHNQLMTGKILGISLVSLTQIGFYVGTAGALRVYLMTQGDQGGLREVADFITPMTLVSFVVLFILGYFLYTSIFAMIGAVCNSEQDAQNLQFPLVFMLMVPYIMTVFFVKHPDSTPAVIASLFPPFTPMIMLMRINMHAVPAWQLGLAFVLMLVSIWFFMRAAAKVFRIGTLMHGKRPTIPEILRWARS